MIEAYNESAYIDRMFATPLSMKAAPEAADDPFR